MVSWPSPRPQPSKPQYEHSTTDTTTGNDISHFVLPLSEQNRYCYLPLVLSQHLSVQQISIFIILYIIVCISSIHNLLNKNYSKDVSSLNYIRNFVQIQLMIIRLVGVGGRLEWVCHFLPWPPHTIPSETWSC